MGTRHAVELLSNTSSPAIKIIVKAVRGGRYSARLEDGRVLLKSVREPFLDAARVLLSEGYAPHLTITMHREGRDRIDMSGTIGDAAKWTVSPDYRFVRWRPFLPWEVGLVNGEPPQDDD